MLRVVMDDDVWRNLPLGPLATLVVGIVGLAALLAATLTPGSKARWLRWFLLGGVVLSILALTLSGGRSAIGDERVVNWHLGAGIRGELNNINQALGLVNILGNVLFFVPLGWLVAAIGPRASTKVAQRIGTGVVAGVLLSICIEFTQYAIGRAADVDDVLLNATGAFFGAAIGAVLTTARSRMQSLGQPKPGRP